MVERLAAAKAPVLPLELALAAGQHDVGGFVQQVRTRRSPHFETPPTFDLARQARV
jgi:hypothetical protein